MTVPGVVLVVPVKRLSHAKSRLDVEPEVRRAIALSLAEHTVRSALATPSVVRVLVVTRDRTVRRAVRRLGADVVRERPRGGLNGAAATGRRAARRRVPGCDVGILVSDLPSLTSHDLAWAVDAFRRDRRPTVVVDHEGTGTTMLLHAGGVTPPIRFGAGSAMRHTSAGYRVAAGAPPGLRQDLDRLPAPRIAKAAVGPPTAADESITSGTDTL